MAADEALDRVDLDDLFDNAETLLIPEKYPEFYHLMTALFLTHTVVFIGYSLNDPDINLLLQFLHNTANSACPHYMIDNREISRSLLNIGKIHIMFL